MICETPNLRAIQITDSNFKGRISLNKQPICADLPIIQEQLVLDISARQNGSLAQSTSRNGSTPGGTVVTFFHPVRDV